MDETRELISYDENSQLNYYSYCQCLKLITRYDCDCSPGSVVCLTLAAPFALVYDIIAFVPQCFVNNILLFQN